MEYTVFNATVSWYDAEDETQNKLRGTGSDEVGLYNWCIEQMETLSDFKNIKHLRFMIVEEDKYYTEETIIEKETKTEGQTEKTSEP